MAKDKNEEIVDSVALGVLAYLKKQKPADFRKIIAKLSSTVRLEQNAGELVTAVAIDEQTKERIVSCMSAKLQTPVILESRVDPRIIGGLIVRIGDYVIDESIKTKLSRLEEHVYGFGLKTESA